MFLSTGEAEGRRALTIWSLLPLGLVSLAILAPALIASGHWRLGLILHNAFALVCHQRPERSFAFSGYSVAVCARCLGIYVGAAMGMLFRISRKLALNGVILATALNLADAGAEFAGLHGNWIWLRFGLGLLLGVAGAIAVSASVPLPVKVQA